MAENVQVRQLSDNDVVVIVRRYLEPNQPQDYRLEVMPDGVKKDGDWWYVLVRPDRNDVRAYDYYDRLAESEVTLRDEEQLNVLLVPVLPE